MLMKINPYSQIKKTSNQNDFSKKYPSICLPPFKVLYAGYNLNGVVVFGCHKDNDKEFILTYKSQKCSRIKKFAFNFLVTNEIKTLLIPDRYAQLINPDCSNYVVNYREEKRSTEKKIKIGVQSKDRNVRLVGLSKLFENREVKWDNSEVTLNGAVCWSIPIKNVIFTVTIICDKQSVKDLFFRFV